MNDKPNDHVFGPDQDVELEVLAGDAGGRYRTVVTDVADDVLRLAQPSDASLPVPPDVPVLVTARADDLVTCFESEVSEAADGVLAIPVSQPFTFFEKRKHLRLPVDASASCRLLDGDGPPTFEARIQNVSAGGVRLVAEHEMHMAQSLSLEFEVDGTPVTAVGRVVYVGADPHTGRPAAGIEFFDVSDEDRLMIVRLVEAKLAG